jgi:hypothetical protein
MGWGNKFPDLKNDPAYLEPRVTAAETSLAEKASQTDLTNGLAQKANQSDLQAFQNSYNAQVINAGSSNSEVVAARSDNNGLYNQTIGTRIGNIEKLLLNGNGNIDVRSSLQWEPGGISGADGTNNTTTVRYRTPAALSMPTQTISVSFPNTYMLTVFKYNADGTFVTYSDYTNTLTSLTFDSSYKYRLVFRRIDATQSDLTQLTMTFNVVTNATNATNAANVTEVTAARTNLIASLSAKDLNSRLTNIERVIRDDYIDMNSTLPWEQGGIDGTGNNSGQTVRYRTPTAVYMPKETISVSFPSTHMLTVFKYNSNGTFVTYTDYNNTLTSLSLDSSYKYRFVLHTVDSSQSDLTQLTMTVSPVTNITNSHNRFMSITRKNKTWFDSAKWGFFSHYTWSSTGQTIYPDGTRPANVNTLANDFNVQKFASDMYAFGVEYVTFTAWHQAMSILYPSSVMNSYVTGHTTTRDVIYELATALHRYNIKFVPYVHLTDGSDMTTAEQTALGWNDPTNGYKKWNDFINALIQEMGKRYGTLIDGFWIDMTHSSQWATMIDKKRLRLSLLTGNSDRVLIGNGHTDGVTADTYGGGAVDYAAVEYYPYPSDIHNWVAAGNQIVTIGTNTGSWWASQPSTSTPSLFTYTDMLRFFIMQSGANNNGGGIAYNAGSYAGYGQHWETGVEKSFLQIASKLSPIAQTIKGTYPSKSWVTPNTATLNNLGNSGIVATTSTDGTLEYVHVLNPPSGATLTLPVPADGQVYSTAILLPDNINCTLVQNASGVTITHPTGIWDTVHTVFELPRNTGLIVKDDFQRADASSLGTTSNGNRTWEYEGTGNALIQSGQMGFANVTGASPSFARIEVGTTYAKVTGTLAIAPANKQPILISNFVNNANFYQMTGNASGYWEFSKMNSGTKTILFTSTNVVQNGDIVSIERNLDTVKVTVNGVVLWSGTVDLDLIGTRYGFATYLNALDSRWDDFKVEFTI